MAESSYRHADAPYSGVICGLCEKPPTQPFGILGWVFDQRIMCSTCRTQNQEGEDLPIITSNTTSFWDSIIERWKSNKLNIRS